MIDININTILSQALTAAVQQATAPLLAQMAEQIAALDKRLLALENNPAQGVDTTLERRVAALEAAQQPEATMEEVLQYLDNQEWFWHKIRAFTDGAVEQAVEQHCEEYDHNDFVTEDKLGEYVKGDDIRDDIRDILNGATVSIRI